MAFFRQGFIFTSAWAQAGDGALLTTTQIRNKIFQMMNSFHRGIDEGLTPFLPLAGKKKISTEITLSQECTKAAHASLSAYISTLKKLVSDDFCSANFSICHRLLTLAFFSARLHKTRVQSARTQTASADQKHKRRPEGADCRARETREDSIRERRNQRIHRLECSLDLANAISGANATCVYGGIKN